MVLVHFLGSQLLSPATFLPDQDLWTTFLITNFHTFVLNSTGELTGAVNDDAKLNTIPNLILRYE